MEASVQIPLMGLTSLLLLLHWQAAFPAMPGFMLGLCLSSVSVSSASSCHTEIQEEFWGTVKESILMVTPCASFSFTGEEVLTPIAKEKSTQLKRAFL